jgi:transposase-like protein
MGMPGPQKINRYGLEFKLKAVQLSQQPGVLVKDVADSLCIHPFMLSKWRKQVRDGELRDQCRSSSRQRLASCSACADGASRRSIEPSADRANYNRSFMQLQCCRP